ncbi:hypothetical protein AgCh_038554 [Apium graveolens]
MAAKQSAFTLSSSSSDGKPQSKQQLGGLGLSFLDTPPNNPLPPPPPPPPCLELVPSNLPSSVNLTLEPLNLDGLTLLKGRVSTQQVFALSNSDLVPGKYEGGLKLWEGSLDLVKTLRSEDEANRFSITGKRVLELGCGHGLPGIFACLKGAAAVHFQDFNAEVLQCLTIPNVNANILNSEAEIRYFAGDWGEVHQLLSHSNTDENSSSELDGCGGYDIILMAETVYSISALPNLYQLIKKCMSHPGGVVYMAAKKHYFGVGGGSRRFLSVVEKDEKVVFSEILLLFWDWRDYYASL